MKKAWENTVLNKHSQGHTWRLSKGNSNLNFLDACAFYPWEDALCIGGDEPVFHKCIGNSGVGLELYGSDLQRRTTERA